jgi:hypothetical protein
VLRAAAWLVCLAFSLTAALAHAQHVRPEDATPRGASEDEKKPEKKKQRTDVTVVPYGGADSDIGVGAGVIASIARLTGQHEPYLWRVESVSLVTFQTDPKDATVRTGESPSLQLPYIDTYLLLSLPHAVKNRLGLDFRVSYTREQALKYYGIGNATEVPENVELGDPRYEYAREHPTFRMRSESRLLGDTVLIVGVAYTHNWITVPPDTLLAEDRDTGSARVQKALTPDTDHGVVEFSYGAGWDDRDNKVSPTSGMYHTAQIDMAPGGTPEFPHRWARLNVSLRTYVPIVRRRLTFAWRAVGDLLLGDPPFYELPRAAETSAIGGAKGVRGVPAQRYHGKIKVFGNLELRARIFDFTLLGQKNSVGAAGFVDAGRLWSDYPPDPELDGELTLEDGFGLKPGLGGGLRVYGGTSFVLRADVAWSPDARPIGAYLGGGEAF